MSADVRSILRQMNVLMLYCRTMRNLYDGRNCPLDCVQELVEDVEWLRDKYADLGKRIDDELCPGRIIVRQARQIDDVTRELKAINDGRA